MKDTSLKKNKAGKVKVWLIVAALVVAGLIAWFGFKEVSYQGGISTMKKAVSGASQEVLKPAGGQEHWGATVTHGTNFLDKLGCVDTNCPQIEARWYVPLADDGYDAFAKEVRSAIIRNGQPASSNWGIQIFPDDLGNETLPQPIEGKTWKAIRIFVTD